MNNNELETGIVSLYPEFIKMMSKYYRSINHSAVYFMDQFYAGKSEKEILTGEKDEEV